MRPVQPAVEELVDGDSADSDLFPDYSKTKLRRALIGRTVERRPVYEHALEPVLRSAFVHLCGGEQCSFDPSIPQSESATHRGVRTNRLVAVAFRVAIAIDAQLNSEPHVGNLVCARVILRVCYDYRLALHVLVLLPPHAVPLLDDVLVLVEGGDDRARPRLHGRGRRLLCGRRYGCDES